MDFNQIHQIITAKMQQDGSEVSTVQLASSTATLGYQSKFKAAWVFTKLHFLSFVQYVDQGDLPMFQRYISECGDYTLQQKGQMRGMQVGAAFAAILVVNTASQELIEFASSRPKKGYAFFNFPVVVELGTGKVHTYRGRIIWGSAYTKWIRQRISNIMPF